MMDKQELQLEVLKLIAKHHGNREYAAGVRDATGLIFKLIGDVDLDKLNELKKH